jgi:hypothetical protein
VIFDRKFIGYHVAAVLGGDKAPADLVETIGAILGASGDDRIQQLIAEVDRNGLTGILQKCPDERCLRINLGGVLICLGCFGVGLFFDPDSRCNFSPTLKKVIDKEVTSLSGAVSINCEEDLALREKKVLNLVCKNHHHAQGPWSLIRSRVVDVIKQQLRRRVGLLPISGRRD